MIQKKNRSEFLLTSETIALYSRLTEEEKAPKLSDLLWLIGGDSESGLLISVFSFWYQPTLPFSPTCPVGERDAWH